MKVANSTKRADEAGGQGGHEVAPPEAGIVEGARSRGPGPIQRAILAALYDPAAIIVLSTTELAGTVLGRTDREAIRQVRRAVDALKARGLVGTWTAAPTRRQCGDLGRPLQRTERRGWVQVTSPKPRMRWVQLAWTARPIADRVGFLGAWADRERAALDDESSACEREQKRQRIADYEAERAELLGQGQQ
jgi:hypothetical protein